MYPKEQEWETSYYATGKKEEPIQGCIELITAMGNWELMLLGTL